MAFQLTSEQLEFRDLLARFFGERLPATEVRRAMESDSGFDASLWKQLVSELGLAGLAIPEARGGQGFGFAELCLAQRAAGAALLGAPLFGSAVLCGRVLLHAAETRAADELLPQLASGEVFALAWVEADGAWDAQRARVEARGVSGAVEISGEKRYVLHGDLASRVLVVAREAGSSGAAGLGLYLVEGIASGLTRVPTRALDLTRRIATLHFDRTPARRIDCGAGFIAGFERALDEARVALANEMLGGEERVVETAVAYAKSRKQFGRAIGSFQAIKHKCADLWIALEGSRAASWVAAEAVDSGDPELRLLAAIAQAQLSDAYVQAAVENAQIHGGVGFTWEYDAHLYLRRAKSSEILLGDAAYHRERAVQALVAREESR
jgi:alkylation response protein AidB-like acyl-CoA dehydrogenase